MEEQATGQAVQPQAFYSQRGALTFYAPVELGSRATVKRIFGSSGLTEMIEGPMIQFHPQADGFGMYVTSDPVEIAALEDRKATVGDIFDGAEYSRRTTPADVQVQQAQRQIESQNVLIQDLQKRLNKAQERQSSQK